MAIRPVTPEDAAAIVELTTPIDPTLFATAASFRTLLEAGNPEGTERLVAEENGRIVAWAPSGVHGDLTGWFGISVDPAYRRRGIGGELYERIEARLHALGAPKLTAQPSDDDGRRFLEQRGYERTNVQSLQALDIQAADLPETPDSAALRDVDPWSLFELFQRAHGDIPSHTPRPEFTREDFAREVVDSPIVDRDASTVILENGEPVAFALVISNRESGRAGAQMTAVRGDRRGRGLAYTVKVASLSRARELGLRTMLTSNDVENAPMLAVNRKLGFRPTILLESFEKAL